MELHQFI